MSGLAVLGLLVVVGIVTGAGFYRYQRKAMDARLATELESVPQGLEERLALWVRLAGPQIHHRLAVVGRFTPDMPWLVTHAVARDLGGPPELWGIDCGTLGLDMVRQEGTRVVVELPAPRALGRATLEGERGGRVPLYAPEAAPDASSRLRELALYLLEDMPAALARDLPGASLEIHVAPSESARSG